MRINIRINPKIPLSNKNNYKHNPLSTQMIKSINEAEQYFCDCYLISSLEALSNSNPGRRLLSKNIKYTPDPIDLYGKQADDIANSSNKDEFTIPPNVIPSNQQKHFQIIFRNIKGKTEKYRITEEDYKKYKLINKEQKNPVYKALEIAMSKLIAKHPFKKPAFCRFKIFHENFEYNLVSSFMEMFTGKKPISLNEKTLYNNLKHRKKEVFALFKKMGKNNGKYSFVIGSGIPPSDNMPNFHCYVIKYVNNRKKVIVIRDKRHNTDYQVPFDDSIKLFKFITGYFDENLI